MNDTAIDWCEKTWNPITGCLHGCEYCYARKQSQRFNGHYDFFEEKNIKDHCVTVYKLDVPFDFLTKAGKLVSAPFPFGFSPTFHRYRLYDPRKLQKLNKAQRIFVGSMTDMFAAYIPDEWIGEVFKACFKAPQHCYMFLTKNPKRYGEFLRGDYFFEYIRPHIPNEWHTTYGNMLFGATVTSNQDLKYCHELDRIDFLSIEPLIEELDCENMLSVENPAYNAFFKLRDSHYSKYEWIIIGAETGNRKNKIVPRREWIEKIVKECQEWDIPVFMKNNLASIWGEPLIQELPF